MCLDSNNIFWHGTDASGVAWNLHARLAVLLCAPSLPVCVPASLLRDVLDTDKYYMQECAFVQAVIFHY